MSSSPAPIRWLRRTAWYCLMGSLLLGSLWACGALYYDWPWWPKVTCALYLIAVSIVVWRVRSAAVRCVILLGGFLAILGWWLTLQPQQVRPWQPDVARNAWAEIQGDTVTIHDLRHFDYQPDGTAVPRWETRTYQLSSLTGIDMFINYWGSPWMSHPILSFQFSDAPALCMSIETRKEIGEAYSAIGGFYRQYELILIASHEDDVIRLRTNVRKGEDSYLYRVKTTPERAKLLLQEYLHMMNQLKEQPRWYNAITSNCTTAIRAQVPRQERAPWDWRILVNGKADELLYERHAIETARLDFPTLRERSHINDAAHAAAQSPSEEFSRLIRVNMPTMAK